VKTRRKGSDSREYESALIKTTDYVGIKMNEHERRLQHKLFGSQTEPWSKRKQSDWRGDVTEVTHTGLVERHLKYKARCYSNIAITRKMSQ
jgi:hypothetical protein